MRLRAVACLLVAITHHAAAADAEAPTAATVPAPAVATPTKDTAAPLALADLPAPAASALGALGEVSAITSARRDGEVIYKATVRYAGAYRRVWVDARGAVLKDKPLRRAEARAAADGGAAEDAEPHATP